MHINFIITNMIVIPMAGKSSRFYNEGYKVPKYKLPVFEGSNVFFESLNSFKNYFDTDTFLFVHRDDDGSKGFIKEQCRVLNIKNIILRELSFDTRGQADTVALGLKDLPLETNEEPLYIFNIDSFLLNFKKPSPDFLLNTGGYLELFKGQGDHWSFAKINGDLVTKTTEKIRISEFCSNGLYYFSSSNLFLETFKSFEINNNYSELFIAPMYNTLIDMGVTVKCSIIENKEILFCGTPDEYKKINFRN
jgi:hypothetical protein